MSHSKRRDFDYEPSKHRKNLYKYSGSQEEDFDDYDDYDTQRKY
jgi:hypothetical protein